MSDDRPSNDPGATHDLRTITARLADLQRKCRSVGSRNLEADEMEQRLGSVLDRLDAGDDDDAPPVPFGALARELYAVERFFESNGFMSVAKEVAHVERALEAFAADNEPESESTPAPALLTSDPERVELDHGIEDAEAGPEPSRWAIPRPLAAVLLFFAAAVITCVAVIYRQYHREPADYAFLQPSPSIPTATPRVPTPTPTPRTGEPTPPPGAVLAREIGMARLALVDGDVDTVIDHLSRASLVDPNHATVLGTARQLVDLLVDRADAAADGGLWEIADLTLARADRIATRYGLDRHRIETSARHYARMGRFRLVQPSDSKAIRAAAGSRVTVFLRDGSTLESIIKGADAGHLLLDEDTEVRGGAMYYTERIPLSDIDYLKVWEK